MLISPTIFKKHKTDIIRVTCWGDGTDKVFIFHFLSWTPRAWSVLGVHQHHANLRPHNIHLDITQVFHAGFHYPSLEDNDSGRNHSGTREQHIILKMGKKHGGISVITHHSWHVGTPHAKFSRCTQETTRQYSHAEHHTCRHSNKFTSRPCTSYNSQNTNHVKHANHANHAGKF